MGEKQFLPPTQLYEISTRPYLYLLSQKLNKTCTIKDIPDTEFDDWKNKGFNYVWFMGIWQVGPNSISIAKVHEGCICGYNENLPGWTEEDIIGSPYCIVQYKINPQVGTLEDLKWVRDQLKKRGMKLMLDFVPNHTAFECPEVESHRNFYVWTRTPLDNPDRYSPTGIAYGKELESGSWTDCAQQNYFDLDFRQHQIKILKSIAQIADGVRCDMSHCVLNDVFERCWKPELDALGYRKPATEFWSDATKAVKSEFPNFIFLAESYHDNESKLIECGFDYAYDKPPYDQLVWNNVHEFKQQIWNRSREYKSHGCFFTENHDERRAVAVFGTVQRANAAAALLLTLPGMRFFNMNQWNGPRNKIDTHLRRALPEDPVPDCLHFYDKLFQILKLDCLRKGEFVQLNIEGSDSIPIWTYNLNNEHVLISVNFSDNCSGGFIRLNDLPTTDKMDFKELLSDKTFTYDISQIKEKGFFVLLDPYQIQIFKY